MLVVANKLLQLLENYINEDLICSSIHVGMIESGRNLACL